MTRYSRNQKDKSIDKLKHINITSEKDILNVKLSELKKINKIEEIENLTIKDIEIIWEMQDAIENKTLLKFFTDTK